MCDYILINIIYTTSYGCLFYYYLVFRVLYKLLGKRWLKSFKYVYGRKLFLKLKVFSSPLLTEERGQKKFWEQTDKQQNQSKCSCVKIYYIWFSRKIKTRWHLLLLWTWANIFMVLCEKFHFPKKPKVVLHHESGKVSCHDELFSSSLN